MAARIGIATVPVPFDDCGFGGAEPVYGPQPDPVPGVHNSRAVASPGRRTLSERTDAADVRAYVRDLVERFAEDPRILFWDLYNEPGNRMIFRHGGAAVHEPDFGAESLELLRDSFAIAREVGPVQPVTAGAWNTPPVGTGQQPYRTPTDLLSLQQSDLITFHAYLSTERVAAIIGELAAHGRPMLCTEWMARPVGSRIDDQVRLFRDLDVGCMQWGLVKGRTQTWLPWPADLVAEHGGEASRDVWFHDILHDDGTPYDRREVEILKSCT
jgi:hypothetical protein